MRTKVKLKGGISLIVLVITIIVMIILAAAIILSLSNSGIISKANKAKTDSDAANLKEYANTLMAEWELMTSAEQEATGCANNIEYANKKLAEKGYKRELAADGKTVMNEAATAAVKAGLKVGDTVTGYTLDETAYTTSGEENTCNPDAGTETTPQPQTVKTNTDITWKYLGINANGEMEIMADLSTANAAAANTKVTLGGKGGCLNGPTMLNTICEKLYSKDGVGTARSMNIEDVNNILGYTGEKGSYIDNNGNEVKTPTALRIGDIVSQKGEPALSSTATPDGRDINTYYSNYYYIKKTNDVSKMTNAGNVNLVYNTKNTYWLASPCVYVYFIVGDAYFYVRYVDSPYVNAGYMFDSLGASDYITYAVRPVVSLKSNVQLEQNTEKTAWVIK